MRANHTITHQAPTNLCHGCVSRCGRYLVFQSLCGCHLPQQNSRQMKNVSNVVGYFGASIPDRNQWESMKPASVKHALEFWPAREQRAGNRFGSAQAITSQFGHTEQNRTSVVSVSEFLIVTTVSCSVLVTTCPVLDSVSISFIPVAPPSAFCSSP